MRNTSKLPYIGHKPTFVAACYAMDLVNKQGLSCEQAAYKAADHYGVDPQDVLSPVRTALGRRVKRQAALRYRPVPCGMELADLTHFAQLLLFRLLSDGHTLFPGYIRASIRELASRYRLSASAVHKALRRLEERYRLTYDEDLGVVFVHDAYVISRAMLRRSSTSQAIEDRIVEQIPLESPLTGAIAQMRERAWILRRAAEAVHG